MLAPILRARISSLMVDILRGRWEQREHMVGQIGGGLSEIACIYAENSAGGWVFGDRTSN